jgi:hypothetical protein
MDPQRHQMSFSMVGKREAMFSIVGFLACKILSNVGSQIETKKIFFLQWAYLQT